MGVQFPDLGGKGGIDLGAPIGSINAMQNKLKDLRKDFRNAVSDEDKDKIKKNINQVEAEISQLQGKSEDSSEALAGFGQMVGDVFAQAIVHGKELEDVLNALIAQLASRALINGIGMLLTGGFSGGAGSIISSLFGFQHGTDMGFPGAGVVGERGKELLVAPPYSSIITNENVERMDRMQREARSGASNVMQMSNGNQGITTDQLVTALEQADMRAIVDVKEIVEESNNYKEFQNRIGNEYN